MRAIRYKVLCGLVWLWPASVWADGVNTALHDPPVTPVIRQPEASVGPPLTIGSNPVGRPGVGPDQIAGYDVNIAWDHVAVGMAVLGGLFLMTEWMERR